MTHRRSVAVVNACCAETCSSEGSHTDTADVKMPHDDSDYLTTWILPPSMNNRRIVRK